MSREFEGLVEIVNGAQLMRLIKRVWKWKKNLPV
jgi:hypothetical protein